MKKDGKSKKSIIIVLIISILIILSIITIVNLLDKSNDIRGYLIDSKSRERIPNCRIVLEGMMDFDAGGWNLDETRTDDDGYFCFEDVPKTRNFSPYERYVVKIADSETTFSAYRKVTFLTLNTIFVTGGGRLKGNMRSDNTIQKNEYSLLIKEKDDKSFFSNSAGYGVDALVVGIDEEGNFQSDILDPGNYKYKIISRYFNPTAWMDFEIKRMEITEISLTPPSDPGDYFVEINASADVPILFYKDSEIIAGGIPSESYLNVSLGSLGSYMLKVQSSTVNAEYFGNLKINVTEKYQSYDFEIEWYEFEDE